MDQDNKFLVSRLTDKIKFCEKTGKIQVIDFLDPVEQKSLQKMLNQIQYKNYQFYGAVTNSQRKMLIIYPEKMKTQFSEEEFDYNMIMSVIRVITPNENYEHKVYLGGLIKLGIKREKIGDIIVYDNGADIIISNDILNFIISNLTGLNRFNKSKIEVVKIENVHKIEQKYEEITLNISSFRLDNFVAELAKTSRNKANEILEQQRVFVNYENQEKPTKIIKMGDFITIRGKGKFIIDELKGNSRSGRYIVKVKKFA